MSEHSKAVLACIPATEQSSIPMSTIRLCGTCGIDVHVSMESLKIAKEIEFICFVCLRKKYPNVEFGAPTAGQIRELRDSLVRERHDG